MKRKKKILLSIMVCFMTFMGFGICASAAVNRSFGYIIDWNGGSGSVKHYVLHDDDAGYQSKVADMGKVNGAVNKDTCKYAIFCGNPFTFTQAEANGDTWVVVSGDFEYHTPFLLIHATRKGYECTGYTDTTYNWAMWAYKRSEDTYLVDAGIYYGDWVNHDDNWNWNNRRRGDGEWAGIRAEWKPITYTIKYHGNGATGGSMDNTTCTYDTAKNLRNNAFTRTGYTFKGWATSANGGVVYSNKQSVKNLKSTKGAVVDLYAVWADETAPTISKCSASPTSWSAGNGTVTVTAQDSGSGLNKIDLYRYSYVTDKTELVKTWNCSNTKDAVTKTYTETSEGVFYYGAFVFDAVGNASALGTETIYLDHSNPVLSVSSNASWTNAPPVISASATDYLSGTSYVGSGIKSIQIKDDSGTVVKEGGASVSYTLAKKYEGSHTFTVVVTDKVGHSVTKKVSTNYDCTPPFITGDEVTKVMADGRPSGYCQNNIISQHVDDLYSHSANGANNSSGLSAVTLYKVKGASKTAIYSATTKTTFASANTSNAFDVYYDSNGLGGEADYYLLVASDFAGNISQKKLVTQNALLKLFHTSIDRSSYEN